MHLQGLIDESARHLRAAVDDGQAVVPLPGLRLIRQHASSPSRAQLYEPVVCVVLQGRKDVSIGDRRLSMGPGDCLLVSHDLPVQSRVVHLPYLALVMDVDIDAIRRLHDEFGGPAADDAGLLGARTHRADPGLLDALRRHVALAGSPDARVLVPLVWREIHYRLLTAPFGATLRSMVRQGSRASAIARAIRLIREEFRSPLAVPDVARRVGMSASAFHEHFRSITSTTPLQYLKEIRLLHAQRVLRAGGGSVTAVALEVGYASPSQFSRDYARKFGVPPSHELP